MLKSNWMEIDLKKRKILHWNDFVEIQKTQTMQYRFNIDNESDFDFRSNIAEKV